MSPIDEDGHGTHTASTAAGAFVANASTEHGLGRGWAAGMAPRAHLAVYKIGRNGYDYSALLKAVDEAVKDGVDILSISMSPGRPDSWGRNMLAIAGFAATARGVLVSTVAGNSGPEAGHVINEAPWLLTVGASTTDRRMRASVRLGNGEVLEGESLYFPRIARNGMLPLAFPANRTADDRITSCESPNQLIEQEEELRGKLIVCMDENLQLTAEYPVINRSENVEMIGGAGIIYVQTDLNNTIIPSEFVLPATTINRASYERLLAYSRSTDHPTATIEFHSTQMGAPNSPSVAELSSRGPTPMPTGILKPDIVGPGMGIIAAGLGRGIFISLDGTSMACPHLSGIAALIKSAHPTWSPAMIKSAIMTTADVLDHSGNPILDDKDGLPASIFAMGAGQVNPEKAVDPGLVYDCSAEDYIGYICWMGYTDEQVHTITGKKVRCSAVNIIPARDLNHPSISVNLPASNTSAATVVARRTVTNVGQPKSTYRAEVASPPGVKVTVTPDNLSFSEANEKKSFQVSFEGKGSGYAEGFLKWISPTHVVQSPIAVTFG